MEQAGLAVRVDAAGNIRGVRLGAGPGRKKIYLGSHLDSVPNAGAYDGILGVALAIAVVDALREVALPFDVEVLGFSEEEGVRFGVPFIGSRALVGTLDDVLLATADPSGRTVADAITAFGGDPADLHEARVPDGALGYFEFHIEQGPVLDAAQIPVAIVDAIDGQTRAETVFVGAANHAGTTPMTMRRDAAVAAAEWMCRVEEYALATPALVATTGRLCVEPNAGNVVPGRCTVSLDVRHADDGTRGRAVADLRRHAERIASERRLQVEWHVRLEQAAVPMHRPWITKLRHAADACRVPALTFSSGAGHDAMVMATKMPVGMLFLRSPGGISHHPDEDVRQDDVAAALRVGVTFLLALAEEIRG